uniref:Transmembrane protein 2 n=2 Tax=Nothobranchius korthausae TaxID=1143690 RepID=A0A1A8FZ47_9TELE
MLTSNGPSRLPAFVSPTHSNHPRCPGYLPGRVAPIRSPPPSKSPPPPPLKPRGRSLEQRTTQQTTLSLSEENQRRAHTWNLQRRKNALICCGVSLGAFLVTLILVFCLRKGNVLDENCPDHNPSLSSWNPGHQPDKAVVVKRGHLFRLESSATFLSLTIQSGGLLVFADNPDGSNNITIRTHHILIEDGGALHIGSPKCRYRSLATIALRGRSDDKAVAEVPGLGRKFIGVMGGGTLELHGIERVSWSLLTRSIPASGLATGGYALQKNFSRGINLRVFDQDTSALLFDGRFDTHDSRNDSRSLTQLLRTLPAGRIVALAVGDSAVKSFLDETKKAFKEILGSRFAYDLKFRQAWALVSVVGGGNTSCSEDMREHENLNTGGRALARCNFTTVDGVGFSVTAHSEWKNGYPTMGFQVDAVDQVVLNLQDEVHQTWKPGDVVLVASTDYSMHQAEEFTLLPCPECSSRQVRIQGKPRYNHVGEIIDGVDMRAEVALLSRNILIYGEMENSCYGDNKCQFFSHDTFGGHIKILANFSSVHLSHVELKNMGQQREKGRYPLHFHMYGIEQRNTFYHNLGLLTQPGTLLPTDRNETLCTSIRDNVYKSYIPSPSTECKAVSTFWIANPNNNLISNAAAGSQDAGIWFVFHRSSTGDSHGLLSFHPTATLRAFFGRPGQWFEENDLDGDKNSIFHDVDGSVSGYRDTYVGRADNYLIQHPNCVQMPRWNGVTCSGRYSQVFIQTQGAPSLSLSISRDDYPAAPLVLRGINSQGASSQQYQPVLMMSKSYTLHWNGPAPREVVLSLINFDKDDWVLVGLCYPPDATFQIMGDINDKQRNIFDDITDYGTVSSLAELKARQTERKYFFDQNVGLLWFYLRARHGRDGHSYCSTKGCERVKVTSTTSSKQTCNCTQTAYPKYSKKPSAVVPMPAPNRQPCSDCGAQQFVFSSEPWTSYLLTQVKSVSVKEQQRGDNASFITVNEATMSFSQPGFFLVSVDACSGKVNRKYFSAKMDSKMEEYLRSGMPRPSIVLMGTRGQPEGLAGLAAHLVSFRLAKAADLTNKESLAMWGLLGGSSSPPWVSLQAGQGDDVLGLQERYLPLALESYGCPPPAPQTRKDLELLRKATGLQ